MPEPQPAITPEHLRDYDVVVTPLHPFTADTLAGAERLTVFARWGVGYEMIDVQRRALSKRFTSLARHNCGA